MHAGPALVLLLHGFPNLAYSWRKVMPALAAAGYYAVAPDCRGFGRTTGWDNSFDADPIRFLPSTWCATRSRWSMRSAIAATAMMVGHDQGSRHCRPRRADPARHVSAPHAYRRRVRRRRHSFPFNTANGAPVPHPDYTNAELDAEYAKLNPPRRGYQDYWASPEADRRHEACAAGHDHDSFFRAFYYMKSHDFPGNQNLQPLHRGAHRQGGRRAECASSRNIM